MKLPRPIVSLVIALLMTGAAFAAGNGAWRKYKGQIIVSDAAIRTDYDSDKEMIDGLAKARRQSLSKGDAEAWEVNFVAFLAKKPGPAGLSLVLYDGKRQFLTAKDIDVDANAEILASSITIGEDDGVKPGSTVEIVLGRKAGGKETVFAKTKVTLK